MMNNAFNTAPSSQTIEIEYDLPPPPARPESDGEALTSEPRYMYDPSEPLHGVATPTQVGGEQPAFDLRDLTAPAHPSEMNNDLIPAAHPEPKTEELETTAPDPVEEQPRASLRPVVVLPLLALGCMLQLAIVANFDFALTIPLTIGLSGLAVWQTRSALRVRAWRILTLLAVVNVLMLALYAWTTTERTHITIQVEGQQATFTATTDQSDRPRPPLRWQWDVENRPAPTSGGIGLWLPPRSYGDHHYFVYPKNLLGKLATKVDESNMLPAWDNIVVRDTATGTVLWQSSFEEGAATGWRDPQGSWFVNPRGEYDSQKGGWVFVGSDDWVNYTVEADLVRGRNVVGISVLNRQDDLTAGAFLLIQPWNEAWQWGSWETRDRFETHGPWRWFRKPLAAHLQETLSLYLKSWQYALLIGAFVILATVVLRWLADRLGRYVPLGSPAPTRALGVIAAPPLPAQSAAARSETGPDAFFDSLRRPDAQRQLFWGALLATALAALVGTSVICLVQLEAIPHVQDSVAYYFQAKILAMGRWFVEVPPAREAFQHQYIAFHQNKWFSIYQPGYPLLLAIGMLFKVPWLINPLLGAGGIIFMALAGARMFRPRVGIVAAIAGLFSPFFLLLTASFMSHATGFFWMSLLLYTLVRADQQPDEHGVARWLVPLLAGVSAAWMFITRPYTAVLLVAPFAIYFLRVMWQRPAWKRWLWAIAGAVPVLGLMLTFNMVTMGHPLKNTWTLDGTSNRLGFATQGLGMRDGHTLSDGLFNTTLNTLELLRHLYGWPMYITLALILVPFVLGAARRWDWLLLSTAGALILGYIAYWAPGIMYGPRYYYEMLPALLLLTGRGVDVAATRARQFANRLSGERESGRIPVGLLCACAVFIALISINVGRYLPLQIKQARGYNYTDGKRVKAVKAAGVHNAIVFIENTQDRLWAVYGSAFTGNDPLLRNDVIYARDLGEEGNLTTAASFPGRTPYLLTDGLQLIRLNAAPATTAPSAAAPAAVRPLTPATSAGSFTFNHVQTIGQAGSGPGQFKDPRAVAATPNGSLFVVDTGNKRVQILRPDGAFATEILGGEEPFVEPWDAVTTSRGEVIVLDSEPGWLYRFDQDGRALGRFGGPDARLFHPRGLTIDAEDQLYIADTGGSRVIKMTTEGQILQVYGTRGAGQGQMVEPSDSAVASDGTLFATDMPNRRVQRFSSAGGFLSEFAIPSASPFNGPHMVVTADGSLLITAPDIHKVQRYSEDGSLIGEVGEQGSADGQFEIPTNITIAGDTVWIADTGNHRLQKFSLK